MIQQQLEEADLSKQEHFKNLSITLLGAGGWTTSPPEVPSHLGYPTSLGAGDSLFKSSVCNWEHIYPSCSLGQRVCWLPNLPAGKPGQHRHSASLPLQPLSSLLSGLAGKHSLLAAISGVLLTLDNPVLFPKLGGIRAERSRGCFSHPAHAAET